MSEADETDVYKRQALLYLMYALFGIAIAATVIAAVFQFGAALKDNPASACLLYTSTTRASLPMGFPHFQLQMYPFFSFHKALSVFYLE